MAQYAYGLLLAGTGDLQQAIEHLETAERLDPANVEYHMGLAGAYSKAGRHADASARTPNLDRNREGERFSWSELASSRPSVWVLPLAVFAAPPAGKTGCANCHQEEARLLPKSAMGIGIELADDQAVLKEHPH